jgi:hypothetical protein
MPDYDSFSLSAVRFLAKRDSVPRSLALKAPEQAFPMFCLSSG